MAPVKNILIIVQARMASSRLPGKVMLPIVGQSLLSGMMERFNKMPAICLSKFLGIYLARGLVCP